MLLNLHKKSWMEGLTLQDYTDHCKLNETIVKEMLELAKNYNKVSNCTGNLTLVFFKIKVPKCIFLHKIIWECFCRVDQSWEMFFMYKVVY